MEQLILVCTNENKAVLVVYEKYKCGKWLKLLETKAFIGKNGIGKEYEGDFKTPSGLFKFGKAFGIKENPGTKLEYIKINENMYLIDDSNSRYYNQVIEAKNKEDIDWKTAEHLYEYEPEYNYVIEIKYNEGNVKNKGSGIFLHVQNNKPTAGCIAISEKDMIYILRFLNESAKIYIC